MRALIVNAKGDVFLADGQKTPFDMDKAMQGGWGIHDCIDIGSESGAMIVLLCRGGECDEEE